jgi:hypothetical protein
MASTRRLRRGIAVVVLATLGGLMIPAGAALAGHPGGRRTAV